MGRAESKHQMISAIAFVTTRVYGFMSTRDSFHVAFSSRYSAVPEMDDYRPSTFIQNWVNFVDHTKHIHNWMILFSVNRER